MAQPHVMLLHTSEHLIGTSSAHTRAAPGLDSAWNGHCPLQSGQVGAPWLDGMQHTLGPALEHCR